MEEILEWGRWLKYTECDLFFFNFLLWSNHFSSWTLEIFEYLELVSNFPPIHLHLFTNVAIFILFWAHLFDFWSQYLLFWAWFLVLIKYYEAIFLSDEFEIQFFSDFPWYKEPRWHVFFILLQLYEKDCFYL